MIDTTCYIYNKYYSHTDTHILTHNKRMKPRKKKEKTDGGIVYISITMYNIQKVISGHKNYD